jgi:hypothetical protein
MEQEAGSQMKQRAYYRTFDILDHAPARTTDPGKKKVGDRSNFSRVMKLTIGRTKVKDGFACLILPIPWASFFTNGPWAYPPFRPLLIGPCM